MPDETQPKTEKSAPDEPKVPAERFLDIARVLGRELGHPVTRGTVAGALALAGGPKKLTRTEMLAALRAYRAHEEV